jgi:O-antigen/teichoic acid export membrane protein
LGAKLSIGLESIRQPDAVSPSKSERLIAHNILVAGSSIAAGTLGFAFQVLISHRLSPSDYGTVFAAMSLLTLVALPASALTLLMARETSRDRAAGHSAASAALLRSGNRTLLIVGVGLGALVTVLSPWIAASFNVPAEFVIAVAAGMPVALALPLLMGELQGQQRFLSFSALNVSAAGLKLAAAIALGLAFGPIGVVGGLAVAATVSYGIACWLLRRRLAIRFSQPWLRPALLYLALILPSTLALSVLLSADVLLVKRFFSPRAAGEYAAVAALGRAIFWGAAGVAAVLFPKVIHRESQGGSGSRIVAGSLGVVALGGIASLVMLGLVARPIITAFAGSAYAAGASILPLYAVAMTLLGGASVLIATHQSRARATFLSVLLPVTVAEPILIVAFHNSLLQVVWVVTLSMALLLAGLAIVMVGPSSRRTSDDSLSIASLAEAQA